MLSGLITRSLSILSGTSLVSLWFVSPASGTLLWTASALSHDPPTSRFSSRETGERKLSKVRVFTLPCFLISPQPLVYGFPWWINSKESACNAGDAGYRTCLDSWVGKISWRRKWQSTPVFLPGKSHGQRSLAGYSPWGRKESDTMERTWHACTLWFLTSQNSF